MYLCQLIANELHFSAKADKLAPGMVYHSNPHRGSWVEVVRLGGHPRVASFIQLGWTSLRFCGTFIYPFGIQHPLDATCVMVSGLSSPESSGAIQYLDQQLLVNWLNNSIELLHYPLRVYFIVFAIICLTHWEVGRSNKVFKSYSSEYISNLLFIFLNLNNSG